MQEMSHTRKRHTHPITLRLIRRPTQETSAGRRKGRPARTQGHSVAEDPLEDHLPNTKIYTRDQSMAWLSGHCAQRPSPTTFTRLLLTHLHEDLSLSTPFDLELQASPPTLCLPFTCLPCQQTGDEEFHPTLDPPWQETQSGDAIIF